MGLWVLAALLILWYNGVAMTALMDKPLAGLSPEARETITKWQRLEHRMASKLKDIMDPDEIRRIFAAFDLEKVKAVLPVKKAKPAPAAAKRSVSKPRKEVVLPTLSGILAIYDADGNTEYLAVIDGKAQAAKSRIGDFLLDRINDRGILLTQDKDAWFIPAPRVDFSLDTRDDAPAGL